MVASLTKILESVDWVCTSRTRARQWGIHGAHLTTCYFGRLVLGTVENFARMVLSALQKDYVQIRIHEYQDASTYCTQKIVWEISGFCRLYLTKARKRETLSLARVFPLQKLTTQAPCADVWTISL